MRQADFFSAREIRLQRSVILEEVSQMVVSRREALVSYPKSDLKHISEEKQMLKVNSSILPMDQLTLPLPQIDAEFGVAKHILKVGLSDLLFLVEMLLLERSVLVGHGLKGLISGDKSLRSNLQSRFSLHKFR